MRKTQVRSLGREDTWRRNWQYFSTSEYFSILAWEIPWTEEPDGLWSMGPQESDMAYQLNNSMYVFIFLSCFDYSIILPLYLFIIENVITTESLAYFIS